MTITLLTTLYKELNLPKELKGPLSNCLGVEIPVEIKEKMDRNKITIQIENAFSGLIYLQETLNKNNTIIEMKEQIHKSLQNKKGTVLYDFQFYNEKRDKITNDVSDKIEDLFKDDDYPVLVVSFKIGNMLMTVDALRVVWNNADCADLMDDACDLIKSIVLDHKRVPQAKVVGLLTEYTYEDGFDAVSIDGNTVMKALSYLSVNVETLPNKTNI
jgi:hypothetical protein